MKKSIIVLAVAIMALLAVTAVMAADPLCAGEASCNSKDTVLGTPKYCTGTGNDAKCEDKKPKEKGNTIAADEYCKDTFKSNTCMTLSTKGCNAQDAYCVFENIDDDGKCAPQSNEDKSSVEEGGRCDQADPTKLCKPSLNLFCHPNHMICTKVGKSGEPCVMNGCEIGTLCNYGICVPYGSLPDFAYATDPMLCKSGKTNNVDQCVPTYAQEDYGQQCISNADCKSNLHEVCDTKAKRCVSSHQHAELDYWTCVGQRCRGHENSIDCMSKCQAAAAKRHCAESCSDHAEKRLPYIFNGVAYSVDCKSLKLTKLEDNKCDIKPADVVTNCDAAFSSYRKSSANSIAGSPAAVLMTVTASVLGALLFF